MEKTHSTKVWNHKHLPKIGGIKSHCAKIHRENSVHKIKKLKTFPNLGLLQVHISVSDYYFLLHFNIQFFNKIMGVLCDCL